ncbi:hypothetical protein CIHG_05548 [Coccidioides immitis H538.4]|uniref:Uncharacterized protein n=2 Tax=Coccidioides immitis TaxID=5501 RepID=A0A0J8RUN8_COCIT|nr:hypothetical protein CIRG_05781 [Coccidioides immitis RMSCC 2394]KMU87779.1 hypothetical protein CIHG_05548 [Coccidioides immitis H538.4]
MSQNVRLDGQIPPTRESDSPNITGHVSGLAFLQSRHPWVNAYATTSNEANGSGIEWADERPFRVHKGNERRLPRFAPPAAQSLGMKERRLGRISIHTATVGVNRNGRSFEKANYWSSNNLEALWLLLSELRKSCTEIPGAGIQRLSRYPYKALRLLPNKILLPARHWTPSRLFERLQGWLHATCASGSKPGVPRDAKIKLNRDARGFAGRPDEYLLPRRYFSSPSRSAYIWPYAWILIIQIVKAFCPTIVDYSPFVVRFTACLRRSYIQKSECGLSSMQGLFPDAKLSLDSADRLSQSKMNLFKISRLQGLSSPISSMMKHLTYAGFSVS